MKVRIFETDPNAAPKKRMTFPDDVVGRVRSGKMVNGRPVGLSTWRITTGDPDVATAVVNAFGGEVAEWETSKEDNLEVITETDTLPVIISSPEAISARLVLWGMGGVPIHECDGVAFLDEDRRGQPCGCPELLAERKAAAKRGHGPKPDVQVRFKLANDPELGEFRFHSASWDFLTYLHIYQEELEAVGGPAKCDLVLEHVSFVPKSGDMAGRQVSYRRPVLRVLGAAS